jgi:hypothetical protein
MRLLKTLRLTKAFQQKEQAPIFMHTHWICPRHCPAVMADIYLGESFGIARSLGAFRPSVTVAVQRNSFDAKSNAALLKFRGAVASADTPQIRKQGATARQVTQD